MLFMPDIPMLRNVGQRKAVARPTRLHGFIKKDQKTPKPELDLAKQRLKTLRGKR
jgi:phage-related protein